MPSDFGSTQWSLVLLARDAGNAQADEALAVLCQTYWYPLYGYIRRQGQSAEQAADLTQEFFLRFLEKDYLHTVDRERGRFRAYLLACCKHFLANERDRAAAQKRGGGQRTLSLNFAAADQRYQLEPADAVIPDRLYQRRWALTLLDQVLQDLEREYTDAGKAELFDHLRGTLQGERAGYAELGRQLAMSADAVKKAAQRLRQRYRELLRARIAATVEDPALVDDEIRELFAALAP
jgi:RNA polymerase sigma-70 factor (ECF subfamily)